MCFVFRSRGTSRAKAALWHVLVVKRLGRAVQFLRQAQHFVNLKVQISWQAGKALCEPQSAEQHFVNLKVEISWQARHFVNLKVQISWQAQHFIKLEVQMSSQEHH